MAQLYDDNGITNFTDDLAVTTWVDDLGNLLGGAADLVTTTTALVSSLNPSIFGQSVTFTATVTPTSGGPPTGNVTFYDLVTSIGTIALDGANPGHAALNTSSLSVGPHNITATYEGDATFNGSSSSVLTQNVNGAPNTLDLIVFTTMMSLLFAIVLTGVI